MNLLTRLAHCSFERLSLFGCRRSNGLRLRSIHLVPDCGRPREHISDSPAPAAAAVKDKSWVLLDSSDCRWNGSLVAGSKTMAETRTSTGQRLRVAFDMAAPPACSRLYYECAETARVDKYAVNAIAAHGDSVLLLMSRQRKKPPSPASSLDHFVYRAGGASRSPSLSLLPALKFPKEHQEHMGDPNCLPLFIFDTGILRRDDGEVLVARIEVLFEHSGGHGMANLCVLRPGRSQWEEKRLVPIHHEEGEEVMGSLSEPDRAIPVGDRFLCWFCGHQEGFILCDMTDEGSPKLRHVPLPGLPYDPNYTDDLFPLSDAHNMGAAGASSVRFVAVEPRCCCGGFGRSSCLRSRNAFTVTTWTLTLSMDEPITWVKEGVLDCKCKELWALQGYEGIPRKALQCPVVSLDNPDVVCFKILGKANQKAWLIEVDTRKKELLGAVQCTTDPWRSYRSCCLVQATLQ